jgi:putative transposase
MITYHEIRQLSEQKAREVILAILKKKRGNVSATARTLKIQRRTVRRARDGTREDLSRRPNNSPRKTETFLEQLTVKEGQITGYRYRRLAGLLYDKYGLIIAEETVKAILRRNAVPRKHVRTANKRRRHLYDYEALAPFAEMQLDTKHVLDLDALPMEVYAHILRHKLPQYEWNIIDAATRIRFTAYSHELSATFGWIFIFIVINWLRTHGVRHGIHIQADNGTEFCSSSKQKEETLNALLKPMNASFTSIPAGKKYLQGIVENSHRHDDEQFLAIHPVRVRSDAGFIQKAQRWQDTWNAARRSWGIGMNGLTPLSKLKQKDNLISSHLIQFPVFLMEDVLKLGGSYVPTNYRI